MSVVRQAVLAVGVLLVLPLAAAAFVGTQTCAGCHTAQFEAWKGSHHALAMQPAETATVLGDFSDASLPAHRWGRG